MYNIPVSPMGTWPLAVGLWGELRLQAWAMACSKASSWVLRQPSQPTSGCEDLLMVAPVLWSLCN